MGIDDTRLGTPFLLGGPLVTDPILSMISSPANVFSLRALAMHECGIPPIGTKIPKWFIVRNPFWAATAKGSIQRYRTKVLRKHGVDLIELDPESYVDAS
jgi:hypothetical protein